MRMLDLFSGIGGFALAAQWVWGDELEIASFVEKDEYATRVLKKHWPEVPVLGDIRDVKKELFVANTNGADGGRQERNAVHKRREAGKGRRTGLQEAEGRSAGSPKPNHQSASRDGPGKIDLITGGFPCQPFSQAGKRDGRSDDRHLWPEMLRVIRLFKPTWIAAENVRGLLSIEDGVVFEQVCTDLEDSGYAVQSVIIPAVAVDANHRRDRVWIVAHRQDPRVARGNWKQRDDDGRGRKRLRDQGRSGSHDGSEDVANPGCRRLSTREQESRKERSDCSASKRTCPTAPGVAIGGRTPKWLPEPNVGRVADGVPRRVDRLKCLGNAIVPQVAEQIFTAIKECELK